MKSELERRNEFLIKTHNYIYKIDELLKSRNLKDTDNIAKLMLEKVFEYEEKTKELGNNFFYQTLTGVMLTKFFLEFMEEEKENIEEGMKENPWLTFLKTIFNRDNWISSYLDDCHVIKNGTRDGWIALTVLLFVDYIKESSVQSYAELEIYTDIIYQELTVIEDGDFATLVLKGSFASLKEELPFLEDFDHESYVGSLQKKKILGSVKD